MFPASLTVYFGRTLFDRGSSLRASGYTGRVDIVTKDDLVHIYLNVLHILGSSEMDFARKDAAFDLLFPPREIRFV